MQKYLDYILSPTQQERVKEHTEQLRKEMGSLMDEYAIVKPNFGVPQNDLTAGESAPENGKESLVLTLRENLDYVLEGPETGHDPFTEDRPLPHEFDFLSPEEQDTLKEIGESMELPLYSDDE